MNGYLPFNLSTPGEPPECPRVPTTSHLFDCQQERPDPCRGPKDRRSSAAVQSPHSWLAWAFHLEHR